MKRYTIYQKMLFAITTRRRHILLDASYMCGCVLIEEAIVAARTYI